MTVRPLVLTGGPAAGKSTTALRLARTTPRAACIEVDDLRLLVQTGGAAPWEGEEGRAQQLLGVRNGVLLVRSLAGAGFVSTVSDVLDAETLAVYRRELPEAVVIRLSVGIEEARRRAATRPVHLSDDEFEMLHRAQTTPLAVDHDIDVTGLTVDEQVEAVRGLWLGAERR